MRPEEVDLSRVAPLFVPATFAAVGNWPGPIDRLKATEVALTWAVMTPNQTMEYVSREMVSYWKSRGLDWKALAMQNLRDHSEDAWTHVMARSNGEIFAVILMHPDGIGPSRLLLADLFSGLFPNGYQVGLPEMSCGVAFSTRLDDSERASVETLIQNCYADGTRPLSPTLYLPEALRPL